MIYSETESGVGVKTTTFVPTSAADLIDQIAAAIDESGYWTVTGSSGDKYATSVENTSGGGYVMKVRMTYSSNTVSFALYDPVGSSWDLSSTKVYVTYAASQTWRVIFSPYWFLAYNTTTVGDNIVYCGVPKMPSKPGETITDAALIVGLISGSNTLTWREGLVSTSCQLVVNNTRSAAYGQCASIMYPYIKGYTGTISLPIGTYYDTPGTHRAWDCELAVDTGYNASNWMYFGFLYDMMLVSKSFAADAEETFDDKTWTCITSSVNPSLWVLKGTAL